jgi:hyperosmotically inducible protein
MNSIQCQRVMRVSSLAALLVLGGCNRPDEPMPGPRADSGAGNAQRADHQARRNANDASTSAAASANAAANNTTAANNTRAMGAPAGEKVDDAAITAKVNASLARDKDLSAIKIDVDTQNGEVTLSGLAPSASAKEQAGEIARSAKGVNSVNNQLTIKSG